MFKILVIDDEELVRKGIVQGTDWDSMGCCVVGEAENGEEGLAAIHRLQPDLLICDIRMPRMDGLQLLEKLREERNDVPVIFLTAYSDFHYAQKALRFAASDYLLKPFEDGELEKAVRTVKEKALEDQGSQNPEEDLMGYFALTKGDKSKYVQEALTYITEHYNEPDISVKSIAESLGLSDGHLSHIFKKETDYTINACITRYRIQMAMKLLKDVRIKVYEVAEMVGYKDITYFSSTFKKVAGVSPSEYQEKR